MSYKDAIRLPRRGDFDITELLRWLPDHDVNYESGRDEALIIHHGEESFEVQPGQWLVLLQDGSYRAMSNEDFTALGDKA